MQFSYVAYTPNEGVLTGRVEAPTELDARADLVNRSYRILKLGPAWKPPGLEDLFPSLFKVGAVEVVRFARQLATMLTSGVGLLRTIEMLELETGNRILRRTLTAIHHSLDEGVSLSEAMAEHPKIFSSLFTSVVQVGEHTGRLGVALEQMADILESEHEAKQKAIQTMMYPVAIIGLSMVTLFVLITIALPPLLAVFEKMEADIPLMTRIAVGGATAVKDNILKIPIGMVGLVIVWSFMRRSPKISLFLDRMRLKAPIIGGFTLSAELARFSRTTAMLLEAGISLSMALQLGQRGCGMRLKAPIIGGFTLSAELARFSRTTAMRGWDLPLDGSAAPGGNLVRRRRGEPAQRPQRVGGLQGASRSSRHVRPARHHRRGEQLPAQDDG